MNRNRHRHFAVSALLLVVTMPGSSAWAKPVEEGAALLSAVPDDVFFCVTGRHNPEREFLAAYWSEVSEAFQQSGILSDVMELALSALSEEQRAEADRLKTRFTELIRAVDWSALGKAETVFAERLGAPKKIGDGVAMMPDLVFLTRGPEKGSEENFNGLSNIMRAVVEEINKAAGKEVVAVTTRSIHDANIQSLRAAGEAGQEIPLSLSIARRKDVVAISMGEELLTDALSLMAGRGSKQPITASPRFREAFAALPPPKDEQTFFDVQALLKPIHGLAEFIVAEVAADAKRKDVVKNAYENEAANAIATQATEAYRAKDYQKALDLTDKALEIAPQDSRLMFNKACFSALLGQKDVALSWLERAVDAGFHAPAKIGSDDDLKSLRDDARFKSALAKAENLVAESAEDTDKVERVQRIIKRVMDIPGMFDYVASVSYTKGHSVHKEEVVALVPDASSKPFYAVFGKRPPLKQFDRYLPKEATSFTISGGIDLIALYRFLEATVRDFGPDGEKILAQWEQIQKDNDFDIRKDLLGWIQGDTISFSMPQPMGEASVMMLRVNDEAMAGEKLKAALEGTAAALRGLATENPMLAGFVPRVSPATDLRLPGFHNVAMGMTTFVCGVADGHLILGTSGEAVATCLATAKGDHPSIRKNEVFQGEALVPDGPFRSLSFADERNFGKNLATAIGVISLSGGMITAMIPDPKVQKPLTKVLGILGKLAPVLAKLDFYKSSASVVTFDGKKWHSHGVTNYVDPATRAPRKPIQQGSH